MLIKAGKKPLPQGLIYGLAAASCLLAPFFVFLEFHNYPVVAAEVLPLYLVPLMVGLILVLLAKLKLVVLSRLVLWACLFVGIIYLHNPYTWLGATWWRLQISLIVSSPFNANIVISNFAADDHFLLLAMISSR